MEAILKKELKEWQRAFRSKVSQISENIDKKANSIADTFLYLCLLLLQHGREPSRADMAKHPDISSTYDTWHAIRSATASTSSTGTGTGTGTESKKRSSSSRGNGSGSGSGSASSSNHHESKSQKRSTVDSNPFKTPTKPKTTQLFKTPTSDRREGGAQMTSASASASQPKDPFRTPSKPSNRHDTSTPSSVRSVLKASMPSPSIQTTPSNLNRFPTSSSSRITSPAQLKAAIASHSTNSPNISGATYTPRTKARKRLRGEEVPPTPAGLGQRPLKKRFGTGSLGVGSMNDGMETELEKGRNPGNGAFKMGLGERKLSDGKTGINALLGKGKGKGKALDANASNFKGGKALEDEYEDEEILEASPIRQSSGSQGDRKFKPLFGGQGLFGNQIKEATSQPTSKTTLDLDQPDGGLKHQSTGNLDVEMELEEGDEVGSKIASSSRSNSPSEDDDGEGDSEMEINIAEEPVEIEEPEKKVKSRKPVPQFYRTEISEDEGEEVEAKKAWEIARNKKNCQGKKIANESNGKGQTSSKVQFEDQDEEMNGISPSKKTSVLIRPYQRYGTLNHRTDSKDSNGRNSLTPSLEEDLDVEEEDDDFGLLDYSSKRKIEKSSSQTLSQSQIQSQEVISTSSNRTSIPTLAGLSLASPRAKATRARLSAKNSQKAHLKHLLSNPGEDENEFENQIEAEVEAAEAARIEEDKALNGGDEQKKSSKNWGEAKANAKEKDGIKLKGKGKGKPNSHKTKKEREQDEKKEREVELRRKRRKAKEEEEKKKSFTFSRAGRSGVGDDEDFSGKKVDGDECGSEEEAEEQNDEESDAGDDGDRDSSLNGSRQSPKSKTRRTSRQKKARALEGSDEDWASEVSSDEYGLGDGKMDDDDVL